MNIKVGDIVTVIGGGSEADKFIVDKKGVKTRRTGKVLKVYAKTNRVIVEGIHLLKKHQRPNKENEPGKIVESEGPIDASNVAIIDPKDGVPTRIGIKVVNGKRVRYAKKSGTVLDDVKAPKRANKGATV